MAKDPKNQIEDELTAVRAIIAAVENLDPALRSRVIQAAQALLPPPHFQPPGPMPPPPPPKQA